MTDLPHVHEHSFLERVILVGPIEEYQAVNAALAEGSWHVTRSGAYTDRQLWPGMDVGRFLILAERQIIDPAPLVAEVQRQIGVVTASLEVSAARCIALCAALRDIAEVAPYDGFEAAERAVSLARAALEGGAA